MQSPLGKYAPLVAAFASASILAVYLASLLFGNVLQMDIVSKTNLQDLAFIAAGVIFGSAVTVNGWKTPLAAAHTRIDRLEQEVNTGTEIARTP